jgi:hypothetical protein
MHRASKPFLGQTQDTAGKLKMDPDGSKDSDYCNHLLLAVDKIAHSVYVVWNCGVFALCRVFVGVDCWIGEELAVVGTEG